MTIIDADDFIAYLKSYSELPLNVIEIIEDKLKAYEPLLTFNPTETEWFMGEDEYGLRYCRCGECNKKSFAEPTKYCPNCGSKMQLARWEKE